MAKKSIKVPNEAPKVKRQPRAAKEPKAPKNGLSESVHEFIFKRPKQ